MQRLGLTLLPIGALASIGLHVAAIHGGVDTASWHVKDAWLVAGVVAFGATLAAAARLEPGRVRTAWIFWTCATCAWLAGSVLRSFSTDTGWNLEPAADALWLLFPIFGLLGLSYRVPSGLLSFRLSLLDAIPVVLALSALAVLVSREAASASAAEALIAGLYPFCFGLLGYVAIQLALMNREMDMWLVSTALILVAAAVLWPSLATANDPVEGNVAALWSLGVLLLGFAGVRRSLAPDQSARSVAQMMDSGWRAVPPTVGLILLIALMLVGGHEHSLLLHGFAVAATVAFAARFAIARHVSGKLVHELSSSRLALEESERRFRSVFASAALGLCMVDSTGRFVFCNAAFSEMLGRGEAELRGITFADITHPDDVGRNLNLWRELMEGRRDGFHIEKRYLHKDGTTVWVSLTSSRVQNSGTELFLAVAEDISERRRTEMALRLVVEGAAATTGEQFFRSLVKHLATSLGVRYAFVARLLDGSENTTRTLAFWNGWEFAGNFNYDLAQSPLDHLGDGRGCAISSGALERFPEDRCIADFGAESYFAIPLLDRRGVPLGVLAALDDDPLHDSGTARSILSLFAARAGAELERLQAETELRTAEERYRTLVEQLPVVTYIDALDEQSTTLYISPQIEDLLGYTVDEWLTDPGLFARILHPDDRDRVLDELQQSLVGQDLRFSSEYRLISRDGRVVWLRDESIDIFDSTGEALYCQGFLLDITAWKVTEAERLRAQALLDSIVDNIPTMLFVKDADELRFVRLSQASEDLLGIPAGEMLGKNDYDFFPREEAEFFEAKDREALEGGTLVEISEEPIDTAHRGRRLLHTKKVPIVDEDGRPLYLLGISEDITEQKQFERELAEQNERLRALDRMKDEFVALVSHELRTPLTSILGYLELILEDAQTVEGFDEQHQHFLNVVERNARRLLRLVGDLLFVGQIEAGQLALEVENSDVVAIAKESIEGLRPRAESAGIALSLDAMSVPTVQGDPARLGQLLDNLVSNAIKFTPSGGQISVKVGPHHDSVFIEVSDSGIGIPADEAGQLFERFFRASSATDRQIQGTGLGLTIARAIVEAHGGTIAVESTEGEGTMFRVELPIERQLSEDQKHLEPLQAQERDG